ncbi:MAG: hypothetical protein GY856_43235, partial [bacterium]|nr:hypothetical protein [bacterium]
MESRFWWALEEELEHDVDVRPLQVAEDETCRNEVESCGVSSNGRDRRITMKKLSEHHEALYSLLQQPADMGFMYLYADPVQYTGRTIHFDGRELLHFANCCYLGLETDPRIKQG